MCVCVHSCSSGPESILQHCKLYTCKYVNETYTYIKCVLYIICESAFLYMDFLFHVK